MADEQASPLDEIASVGSPHPAAPPAEPTEAPIASNLGNLDYRPEQQNQPPAGWPTYEPKPAEWSSPLDEIASVAPDKTSAIGAAGRSAARSAIPALTGLSATGSGAEIGGLIGAPLGPVGEAVGAVGGALVANYGGAKAADAVQNWALSKLPDSFVDAFGQNEKTQRLDQQQHPVASFVGGLIPYAVTMKPGPLFEKAALPENATALQRLLYNPVTARLFGGGVMGGMELASEAHDGQDLDWRKVGIATAFGTIWNKPTKLGEAITEIGAGPTRRVLGRPSPTVAQAGDLKVMGPGVTEKVFQGTHEQAPEASMTAQENARAEHAALGEPPEPDVGHIARRMEPELFGRYEELLKRREAFGAWAGEGPEVSAGEGLTAPQKHLADTNAEIEAMAPQIAAAYRRAAETAGTETSEAEPFPSFAAMIAAHEHGTGQPTVKPEVPNEQAGPVPEVQAQQAQPQEGAVPGVPGVPAGGEAPGGLGGPAGAPAPVAPRPQRSIGDQRAHIAGDVARRLIAAGRPPEEAEAAGHLIAARYVTRAGRFEGKLGTPEELYARESASIAGPGGQALTPAAASSAGEAKGSDITLPTSGPATQEPSLQTTERAPPSGVFSKRTMAPSQDLGLNNVDMGMPSGRRVYHTVNNVEELERLARDSKPDLDNLLKETVDGIDGAEVYGSRAKERASVESKFTHQGREPNQVSDWLGGRIMVDSWPAMEQVIDRLKQDSNVRIVDDFMNEPKGGGYRAVHLQIMGDNGLSAEVQIQPREMTVAGEEAHKIYSKWRRREISPEEMEQAQADEAASQKLYQDAWNNFTAHAGDRPVTHGSVVQAALDARDVADTKKVPAYSQDKEGTPRGPDEPAGSFMFDPTKLEVDAKRFQFKSGGDEYGVTGALRSVQKWDPAKAQSIIVWEQNDGKLFVADGHQRAGLARRLTEQGKSKDIQLPGVLYREKDGISAGDIKAIAAVTNIANGSGSALDGAKVLRARPDLLDESLPLSAGKGKQAAALARLGDEPFKMVVNDVIPENYGAVVGDLIPKDHDRQLAAIKAIARFEPKNETEAAVLTQRVAQAELAKREEGAQASMFGDLETAESTAGEEMKIVGRAIADLKKDKSLFARVLSNAERIERTGSSIEREAARSATSEAEIFAKTLTSEAYTAGPLRTELVKAARELKDGKLTASAASARIVDALRGQAEAHGADRAGVVGHEPERELAQSDQFDFEAGAEGKPQSLIPGVAPVTARERIQALANKPMQGGNKPPPEGGLFGSSRDQQELFQIARGKIRLGSGRPLISLLKDANASTFVHESGHQFLEEMLRDAALAEAPEVVKQDTETVKKWLGVGEDGIQTKHHEKFARGFEQYMREGVAPSQGLGRVFAQFRNWLLGLYQTIKGLGQEISPEIRSVFDRMLEMEPQRTVIAPERLQPDLLHDIHEAEAAHTEPHEAEGAADRIVAESNRYLTEPPKEIQNELQAASGRVQQTEVESHPTTEPGGSTSAVTGQAVPSGPGAQALVDGGAGPGTESGGGAGGAEHGAEQQGGAGPVSEGAAGAVGPDVRSKLGSHDGTALAPSPATLFGPEESPLVDKAGNIRIDNLTNRSDVAQAIRVAAQQNNEFIGDRRGVITDGQMLELADALGMDEASLNRRQLGQAFNAEQIVAARKLLVQSATHVSEAMKKAATGTDADVMAYAQAKDRHQMIQAQVAGITAEAGRALRAFRSIAGMDEAKQIGQFVQEATGKTLFQLKAEAKLGAQLQTPQQVSKFMQDAQKHTFGRMVLEYWINGLISGPATHMTYAVGNTISTLMRIPEQLVASGVGRAAAALGREGPRVHAGEAFEMAKAGLREIPSALKAGVEAVGTGVTTQLPGEHAAQGTLPFQPGSDLAQAAQFHEGATYHDALGAAFGLVRGMRDGLVSTGKLLAAGGIHGEPLVGTQYSPLGAIPDITLKGVNVLPIGSVVRAPGRLIAAIHSFYRSTNFSMEKAALAYRKGVEEGLDGEALASRVAQIRSDPSEAQMNEIAAHGATGTVLMGKGSELTQALSRVTNARIFGFPLLKFIDPFVHISGNIIEQSVIQRTPAGLLTLFNPETELARDLTGRNGGAAQDKAIGRMLVGSALSIAFGSLAAEGMMSGSGPKDPKESSLWRLMGNQAHSIRIGDFWYDTHKLGPLGMLAGISADLYDVAHDAEHGEFLKAAAHLQHAFAQNILDESFMRGPAELIQAIEDPGRYGEAYVRNFVASFVPFSVASSQITRATDPYTRQARTVTDAIKAKIPGLSETLYPRRDIWGEPMPSREVLGVPGVSAIYATRIKNDPVMTAMQQLNIFPGAVEKKIRNVELTPKEYDDFARIAGKMAKPTLDKIVNSPSWATLPAEGKHYAIQHAIEGARDAAREMIMAKYPHIPREGATIKQQRARGEKPQ